MSAIQTPWENLKWGLGKCLLLIHRKGEEKRYIPRTRQKGLAKNVTRSDASPREPVDQLPRSGWSSGKGLAGHTCRPQAQRPDTHCGQVWELGQPLDQAQGGLRGCRESWPLPCKLGSNPVPIRMSGTRLEDHIRTVWCVPVTLSLHCPAGLPPRVLGVGRRP